MLMLKISVRGNVVKRVEPFYLTDMQDKAYFYILFFIRLTNSIFK